MALDTTSSGQDVTLFMIRQADEITEVKPDAAAFITPSGPVALSQVPISVESRERRGRSYDAPAQLTAGVGKGTGSFQTYVKPSGVAGTPPEIGPLLESLFGHEDLSPGFDATPVPTVSGGSGSGATITSITVNGSGQITAVDWDSGGSGYATGDVIVFTQGDLRAEYTLVAGDHTGGGLDNFATKTITAAAIVRYRLRSPDDPRLFYTLWRLLGTTLRRAVGAYVTACTFRIGATRDQEGFVYADWTVGCYSLLKAPTDENTAALTAGFAGAPAAVPTVSGGSGTGATITSITVNADGEITAVTWASGGTGYVAGDVITFSQGDISADYTLVGGDLTAGVLQAFASKTIAPDMITVPVRQVEEFAVGQYLTLNNGREDNGGDGFRVEATDAANDEITLSGRATADIPTEQGIRPWTPATTRAGDELGGRIGTTSWGSGDDFQGIPIISFELPVDLQVADIPGQQGDGQYVRGLEYGQRQISWSMTLLHTPEFEALQSHILLETERDMVAVVGDTPGERVRFTLNLARITGVEEVDGTPLQMRVTGTAQASDAGNDVLRLAFT